MSIRKKPKPDKDFSEKEEEYIVEDYRDSEKDPKDTSLITLQNADQEVIKYLAGINSLEVLEKGLTPDQYARLKDTIKINSMGIGSNIIRTCQDTCESWNRCPLAIIRKAPLGRACPVEIDLYERLVTDYKDAVTQKIHTIKSIEDIEKDPVILSLISQVVEIEIMSFRANALIADVGLTMLVPAFATETGTEFVVQESVASRDKRELNNRRDKILRQLLATPEMVQRIKNLQRVPTITEQKKNILDQAKKIATSSEIVIDEADTAAEAAK
jgi:hypothetical protein